MDIISLSRQVDRLQREGELFDLFRATVRNNIETVALREYIVPLEEEMRIDLIMKSIYELDFVILNNYYKEVDVLLAINNIDNPLNIKRGMTIFYPTLSDLQDYRIGEEVDLSNNSQSALRALAYPSKKTRTDESRGTYNKTGLALPPTAKGKPKDAASFKNGNFSIGGL